MTHSCRGPRVALVPSAQAWKLPSGDHLVGRLEAEGAQQDCSTTSQGHGGDTEGDDS